MAEKHHEYPCVVCGRLFDPMSVAPPPHICTAAYSIQGNRIVFATDAPISREFADRISHLEAVAKAARECLSARANEEQAYRASPRLLSHPITQQRKRAASEVRKAAESTLNNALAALEAIND